jgi:hypothetical protein
VLGGLLLAAGFFLFVLGAVEHGDGDLVALRVQRQGQEVGPGAAGQRVPDLDQEVGAGDVVVGRASQDGLPDLASGPPRDAQAPGGVGGGAEVGCGDVFLADGARQPGEDLPDLADALGEHHGGSGPTGGRRRACGGTGSRRGSPSPAR